MACRGAQKWWKVKIAGRKSPSPSLGNGEGQLIIKNTTNNCERKTDESSCVFGENLRVEDSSLPHILN